jgi:hypothetical protein
MHRNGCEILAADPENLEGLRMTGGISERIYSAIGNATYTVDTPDMERLSDIAAQGRECIAQLPKVGPGVMAELDTVLARFGIAWNPRPRPFAYRTDKNMHPLMKLWADQRQQGEQREQREGYWMDIVRRVDDIERGLGTGVLKDCEGRDGMQGVALRLAFLSGYLETRADRDRRTRNMRDITPDPEQDDGEYETAGNLICLPGVKLAELRPGMGDDPGPAAA